LIIQCRRAPADDARIFAEIREVLERRGEFGQPPVTLTVSDAVAVGIASLFRSPTPSGVVFDRFCTRGAVDHEELIEAAKTEQGYASPEGHAALHCLIGWVKGWLHRQGADTSGEPAYR